MHCVEKNLVISLTCRHLKHRTVLGYSQKKAIVSEKFTDKCSRLLPVYISLSDVSSVIGLLETVNHSLEIAWHMLIRQ